MLSGGLKWYRFQKFDLLSHDYIYIESSRTDLHINFWAHGIISVELSSVYPNTDKIVDTW